MCCAWRQSITSHNQVRQSCAGEIDVSIATPTPTQPPHFNERSGCRSGSITAARNSSYSRARRQHGFSHQGHPMPNRARARLTSGLWFREVQSQETLHQATWTYSCRSRNQVLAAVSPTFTTGINLDARSRLASARHAQRRLQAERSPLTPSCYKPPSQDNSGVPECGTLRRLLES